MPASPGGPQGCIPGREDPRARTTMDLPGNEESGVAGWQWTVDWNSRADGTTRCHIQGPDCEVCATPQSKGLLDLLSARIGSMS